MHAHQGYHVPCDSHHAEVKASGAGTGWGRTCVETNPLPELTGFACHINSAHACVHGHARPQMGVTSANHQRLTAGKLGEAPSALGTALIGLGVGDSLGD